MSIAFLGIVEYGDIRYASPVVVKAMYRAGMTQAEIGECFGVTQVQVFKFMRRRGIAARVAAKRDQRGERNDSWVGDDVGYKAAHQRVYRLRGRANHCERCGLRDAEAMYHWANLTGNYPDPTDYESMCVPCHRAYDAGRRDHVSINS